MPRARLVPVSLGFGALAIVALCSAARAQQPDAPRVLRFVPAHDASEVDPALTELQVVFDRDMDQKRGWTFCGGGPSFPAASAIAWRDARTLVLTVALKPGQRYETTLNCANSAQRFRDASGKPLAATPWVFTTSGTAPKVPPVNAETNARAFAALQEAIETRYSHRDRLVDVWGERFATHREALLGATTGAQFAQRAATLLGAAQDPHLWFLVDGALVPSTRRTFTPNFSRQALDKALPELVVANELVLHATIGEGATRIGYLAILGLDARQAEKLAAAHDALRAMRDCAGIVLDLRANGGGNEMLGMQFARWFVDGEGVYAKSVVRDPESGAWDRVLERRIAANTNEDRYAGPLVVLQGPACLSSCEGLLLMLKRCPRATFVGANSGGSSGNPQPVELANGVTAYVPSWRALDAADNPLEGLGIAPDVELAIGKDSFRDGDPVLARALELLRDG